MREEKKMSIRAVSVCVGVDSVDSVVWVCVREREEILQGNGFCLFHHDGKRRH